MNKKKIQLAIPAVIGTLWLSGCGESDSVVKSREDQAEPVTLKFYQHVLLPDDYYKKVIEEPIKKKFPNVTLELVKKTNLNWQYDLDPDIHEKLADGSFPDLIYTSSWHTHFFKNVDVPLDLRTLVKENRYNLDTFVPQSIEAIKKNGDNGELYGIPFTMNHAALFYNKDIFDKFAVAYPGDGITWDEVIELSRKLTRKEGDVQYYGTKFYATLLGESFPLPYFDKATGKADFRTDGWKKMMQFVKTLHEIPATRDYAGIIKDNFAKNQILAMAPENIDFINALETLRKEGAKLNWDFVSYPNHKEVPGVARTIDDVHNLMISKASKHQELAFQIISFLTNEENQLRANRNGRLSSLKGEMFQQTFGSEIEVLKGKNTEGIFKNTPAPLPPISPYNYIATSELSTASSKVAAGIADINTALREAEEATDKRIEAAKSGNVSPAK